MLKITFVARESDGMILLEINQNKKEFNDSHPIYKKTKDYLKGIAKKQPRVAVKMSEDLMFW